MGIQITIILRVQTMHVFQAKEEPTITATIQNNSTIEFRNLIHVVLKVTMNLVDLGMYLLMNHVPPYLLMKHVLPILRYVLFTDPGTLPTKLSLVVLFLFCST